MRGWGLNICLFARRTDYLIISGKTSSNTDMRVCILSRSLKTHRIGGMENHIDILSRGLADSGHQVTVLTTGHPEREEVEVNGNIQTIYLSGTQPGVYTPEWWQGSKARIAQMIHEEEIDIFHSQSIAVFGALDPVLKSGRKLITTSHGTPLTDAESYWRTAKMRTSPIGVGKMMFYLPHHRRVYRSSNRVIAVSGQLAAHISKWGFAPVDAVSTIPNGIDLDRFKPGKKDSRLKSSLGLEEEKVLLFVGRVTREKGVELALKALPDLKKRIGPVKLVIVGEGDFESKVLPLAKSLGVEENVALVGRIDEEMIPAYHDLADIFLIPSTRWEAHPLALLEAMACGGIVVASNVGGIPSVVRDSVNGILFEKGSVDGLVQGCMRALSSTVEGISANARETAERSFDANKMVEGVIQIYDETLS
jgi:glycosyltransferase involved in cell wall biosynthesis